MIIKTEKYTLYNDDCLEVLKTLPDNFVDSIVTDPPAGIGFMNKSWDSDKGGRDNWISWMTEIACECIRILKPGGHALVWAIPKTSHWTATACENAGFEIRDRIIHCFGSGFPKNLDISKSIDKKLGVQRKVVGNKIGASGKRNSKIFGDRPCLSDPNYDPSIITSPETDEAKQWEDWGTALKPAVEDWWLCRKPLEGSVAENVLKYGTGGINIDKCRIIYSNNDDPRIGKNYFHKAKAGLENGNKDNSQGNLQELYKNNGRYPANLIHDGSDEIEKLFPETKSGKSNGNAKIGESGNVTPLRRGNLISRNDVSSASRFFYCAKASKKDREEGLENFIESDSTIQNTSGRRFNPICDNTGERIQNCSCGNCTWSKDTNPKRKNVHPTVKPVELMKYLCRLITPPGGIILDPFMGSGSTGKAAILENFNFIGVEKEFDYFNIAKARIEYVTKNLLEFLET